MWEYVKNLPNHLVGRRFHNETKPWETFHCAAIGTTKSNKRPPNLVHSMILFQISMHGLPQTSATIHFSLVVCFKVVFLFSQPKWLSLRPLCPHWVNVILWGHFRLHFSKFLGKLQDLEARLYFFMLIYFRYQTLMLGNSTKRPVFKDIQNYFLACSDQRKSISLFPLKK